MVHLFGELPRPAPSNQFIPYSGLVKNTSSMVPIQKVGKEYSMNNPVVINLSAKVPFLTAENTPKGTAKIKVIVMTIRLIIKVQKIGVFIRLANCLAATIRNTKIPL